MVTTDISQKESDRELQKQFFKQIPRLNFEINRLVVTCKNPTDLSYPDCKRLVEKSQYLTFLKKR